MTQRGSGYELTGLQRTYLETVRERITDEDRAPELVVGVDEDGMLQWRVAPVNEQLAYLVARWLFEEGLTMPFGDVE